MEVILHIKQPGSQSSCTFIDDAPSARHERWDYFDRGSHFSVAVLLILMHHVKLTYMATTGVRVSQPVLSIARYEERRNVLLLTSTTKATDARTTVLQRRSHEHENLPGVRESSTRLET